VGDAEAMLDVTWLGGSLDSPLTGSLL